MFERRSTLNERVNVYFFIFFQNKQKMTEAQISVYLHDKNNNIVFSDYFKFNQNRHKWQLIEIPKGGNFFKIYYYNGASNIAHSTAWSEQAKILITSYDETCKITYRYDFSFDETKMFTDLHMIEEETNQIEIVYMPAFIEEEEEIYTQLR